MKTIIGLERLLENPAVLVGKRIAVLTNSGSVTSRFEYTWDAIARIPGVQLASIWSPQHGLFGQQQANMIESPHRVHPEWNVPIYSLYSETREPTPEMMAGVDLIVIDLQDVGTRVYTFAWTILACMKAAAKQGISVCLLDRPNPIGGSVAEGPVLNADYKSFVGMECIPMRHGLTLGELALLCKQRCHIDLDLRILPMEGWNRSMLFDSTGLSWLPPSPNVPTWETAIVYPGQVLIEGVLLSEGRGTTRPFECIGAPFIDGSQLADQMNKLIAGRGVVFRPIQFVPTFDKFAGEECGGVFLHVTDRRIFRSLNITVALLLAIRSMYADSFEWLPAPYEYEFKKPPIDILWGSDRLRTLLNGPMSDASDWLPAVDELTALNAESWWDSVEHVMLAEYRA